MTSQSTPPPFRRRVFYIPGFDPYPARRYRELYRSESSLQAGISGYDVQMRARIGATGYAWNISAQFGDARGTRLLAVYDAGLGIPFLLVAVFIGRAVGVLNRIKPYMGMIEKTMGLLLVLVGLALVTGAFSAFSYWLLEVFPALALLG